MEILVRISYFVIPIISLGIAALNHFFTSYGMSWYKTIALPSFTPPRWVIEIMWQLIYLLTTIAVIIVWNRFKRNMRFWLIMILFVINAFLNVYWHYLFFYQHQIGAAIIGSLFLQLTVLLLIFLLWPLSRMISWFLIPYAIWEFFAIFLTTVIWYMN
ncbi:MAG TPA: tryptophan-rich sensory protein [Candidatus Dependentiae bacterium]|nr:tryptophan-rich sensory protein [Candidatus Dependentiae bacterium]